MQDRLDSIEVHHYFFLESCFPGAQARSPPIKNHCGSRSFHKAPGRNHENLHEEWKGKIIFGNQELVMYHSFIIPDNIKFIPSSCSTRTVKKQVLQSFFSIATTHDTAVILQELISSPQHISSI